MAEKEHIILFPYMAQGHIIPFVALATHLEQRTGYAITFVNTPLNIKNIKCSLPPNTSIRLASLPFNGSDHGLPPNSENTESLTHSLIQCLFQASLTLQPSFENLISNISKEDGRPPLCIISDVFFGWTVEIANKFGIFHSVFITSGAYGSAVDMTLWLDLPHSRTDSDEFQLPGFPDSFRIHRSQLAFYLKTADGSDSWSRLLRPQFSLSLRSDGFLLNTVEELEKTGFEFFRRKTSRPCWAIGPLQNANRGKMEQGISVERCISWLNLHPPKSVLFIAFGSMNSISASQMMELAMGLEASGKPFIWVIRSPLGFNLNGEFRAEWLPEGFEERITEKKQGLLVRKWAPQLETLSHGSTGAFLSHCGWNSTLESLTRGVPMIGWPLSAEQFYNAKMMVEELGVCVEIARGSNAEIDRGLVVEVMDMVMGDGEIGKEVRSKASQVKQVIADAVREDEGFVGSSIKALGEFTRTVISARDKLSRD